jgi:hypothetical protein
VKKLKDVVSVAKAVVSAAATTVDVATAVANNGAFGVVVPPSLLTKDEGAYIGASVAFDSACVSVFADGTGQLGGDDNVESAGGEVGHDDRGPRQFDRRGRGDRRLCHHRRHRCCLCHHRRCRCRHLPRHGSGVSLTRAEMLIHKKLLYFSQRLLVNAMSF